MMHKSDTVGEPFSPRCGEHLYIRVGEREAAWQAASLSPTLMHRRCIGDAEQSGKGSPTVSSPGRLTKLYLVSDREGMVQ